MGLQEGLVVWLSERLALTGLAADLVAAAIGLGSILVVAWIADRVVRRLLLRAIERVARSSRTDWDDALVVHGFFVRAGRLAPGAVIYLLAPVMLPAEPAWAVIVVQTAATVYLVLAGAFTLDALVSAARDIYRSGQEGRSRVPTGGVVQLLKILIYLVAGILIVSALLGRTPVFVLSGLGAMTAVLILVFRDPLLGLMGGIHLTTNDMVRVGDWIEMPKYGADGEVLDITLTSVKVRNWDKTITTVPTYSLISDSFKNWRGMSESGGRRIKRSIHIDMHTVRFVDEELLERFRDIRLLREHIARKTEELERHNRELGIDAADSIVNGRKLTNLGCFRAYLLAYLREHPQIHDDMTLLVRQLQPGPEGLPMEIYVFSRDQAWASYESIQADIFDHLLASIGEFDLQVFQSPSGSDFRTLVASGAAGEPPPGERPVTGPA